MPSITNLSGKRITPSEYSIDVQRLYERLVQLKKGEVVSYKELNDLIGRNVQTVARNTLTSARKKIERENRVVTDCLRNEGVRRLNDSGILGIGYKTQKRTNRASQRTVVRLACAEVDELTLDENYDRNTLMSMHGMILEATKPASFNLLRERVMVVKNSLPTGVALEVIRGI